MCAPSPDFLISRKSKQETSVKCFIDQFRLRTSRFPVVIKGKPVFTRRKDISD